jgi:hypothetical protein
MTRGIWTSISTGHQWHVAEPEFGPQGRERLVISGVAVNITEISVGIDLVGAASSTAVRPWRA